ncbi:hypothetical protein HYU19_04830 [Candidatus Woesearchaeota archaeon]|nr:hypothetical protein [Candidatus Woesearchaeota archaeon]
MSEAILTHPSVRRSLDNFVEIAERRRGLRTTNVLEMASVLDQLGERHREHGKPRHQVNVHWEDIGWHTLRGAQARGNVLSLDFGADYLVRPLVLSAHYFPKRPEWSFFHMGYNGLPPSGVYDYREEDEGDASKRGTPRRVEEYVDDNGRLLPRWCWDEERTPDDQTLSSSARLVVRELAAGNFMIVPKGNPLNSVQFDRYRNDIAKRGDASPVLKEMQKEFGS